jgi:hypothetical protein
VCVHACVCVYISVCVFACVHLYVCVHVSTCAMVCVHVCVPTSSPCPGAQVANRTLKRVLFRLNDTVSDAVTLCDTL